MTHEPKKMHFVKSPRSELRSSDGDYRATKHSRLDMFEEDVRRTSSWLDDLLDWPLTQAVLFVASAVAVIGGLAFLLGWRP
jgi:hypothetical protein